MGASATAISVQTGNTVSLGWIVLPSQAREYTNPTLVRTRGVVGVRRAAPGGVGDVLGAIGIIAWASRDDTLPAAPPQPFFDDALDWIWHRWLMVPSSISTADVPYLDIEIDSKAMRKLGADEGVLFVMQNAAGVDTNGFAFGWGARALIKE